MKRKLLAVDSDHFYIRDKSQKITRSDFQLYSQKSSILIPERINREQILVSDRKLICTNSHTSIDLKYHWYCLYPQPSKTNILTRKLIHQTNIFNLTHNQLRAIQEHPRTQLLQTHTYWIESSSPDAPH